MPVERVDVHRRGSKQASRGAAMGAAGAPRPPGPDSRRRAAYPPGRGTWVRWHPEKARPAGERSPDPQIAPCFKRVYPLLFFARCLIKRSTWEALKVGFCKTAASTLRCGPCTWVCKQKPRAREIKPKCRFSRCPKLADPRMDHTGAGMAPGVNPQGLLIIVLWFQCMCRSELSSCRPRSGRYNRNLHKMAF